MTTQHSPLQQAGQGPDAHSDRHVPENQMAEDESGDETKGVTHDGREQPANLESEPDRRAFCRHDAPPARSSYSFVPEE